GKAYWEAETVTGRGVTAVICIPSILIDARNRLSGSARALRAATVPAYRVPPSASRGRARLMPVIGGERAPRYRRGPAGSRLSPHLVRFARDDAGIEPEEVRDLVHREHALVHQRHRHDDDDGSPNLAVERCRPARTG